MAVKSFARVVFTEGELGQLIRLDLGLEQIVYIEADRGPLIATRIATTAAFRRTYGERPAGDPGLLWLAVERALDHGAILWICRLIHYTDPTDNTTFTAVAGSVTFQDQAGAPALHSTWTHREVGLGTNNFTITTAAGTVANTFKATISCSETGVDDEVFDNLSVDPDEARYFETIINNESAFFTVVDASPDTTPAFPADLPAFTAATPTNGAAGTAINAASIIGDLTAGTGYFAADNALSTPEVRLAHQCISSEVTVVAGGCTWADTADVLLFMEVPDHTDPADAVDFRMGTGTYVHTAFDSSFAALVFGRHVVYDTANSTNVTLPVVGELAPMAVRAFNQSRGGGFWLAMAGDARGKVSADVLGLSYDVGLPTRLAQANALTEAGINPFVTRSGKIRFWGNFTLASDVDSVLREIHTRNLLIGIKRLTLPAFDPTVFEPNRPTSWKAGWLRVKPIVENLAKKGAIFVPDGMTVKDLYLGDIDVTDINNEDQFTSGVNTPTTVAAGKYKVRLIVPRYAAIDEPLEVIVEVTNTAVNFAEILPNAA